MPRRTLKKRKDGRYEAKIYLGLDENRKKIYKSIYGNTPKEVYDKETELKAKMKKGIDIMSLEDSFAQWANRLCELKQTELNDSEYATFTFRCAYFTERIGYLALKDVSQINLQPLINDLLKRNPSTSKPSSKRTIERYLSVASQVFEYAIENRATDFNPCKYVKIPKAAKTAERRALTLEERIRIEEMPHRAQLAAMLMMYSGLRRGEATALLWSDIDFTNKTISVTKSYDFKECELKEPKTESGKRIVSIPQKLVDYLSTIERKSPYVLTTADGRMMTDSAWKRMWDSYMCDLNEKYGTLHQNKFSPHRIITIEPFTPHCLRHTFCTLMYESGVDVLTAREQMGHSDVKTTLAIYTHLDKLHKTKNISKMDEYLSKVVEQ